MSDQGEKTCPLCAEEMDLTDQQLKPCKCGYEICVWCWHHIIDMAEKDDTEGRCPACRIPYDKEKIVGMASNERLADIQSERKLKSQKPKPKASDGRKHLSSVRVIQRNLVYIIGIPSNLADEDLLQRREYFAQYGKVLKVSIARTAGGAIQHSPNNTCSVYYRDMTCRRYTLDGSGILFPVVHYGFEAPEKKYCDTLLRYITYSKEEEAVRCIQLVHGYVLEGKPLRACFGTTKYCHAWLRNMTCSNPDCLYLHEIGTQEDSFTKDEIISAYTRNRVQQITGATNNLQRRSGNTLPPPMDDFCVNTTAPSAKPIAKITTNNPVSHPKGSPPNGSSGRSLALPAAASWGLRVSNGRPPTASSTGLSEPAGQRVDTSNGPSTAVTGNIIQGSTLYSDVGINSSENEESQVQHSNGGLGQLESSKQCSGKDVQETASDSLAEVVRKVVPATTTSSGQLPSTYKDSDRGLRMQPNITQTEELGRQSHASSSDANVTPNGIIQSISSTLSSMGIDSHSGSGNSDVIKPHISDYDILLTKSSGHHASQQYNTEHVREPLISLQPRKAPVESDGVSDSREFSDLRSESPPQSLANTYNGVEEILLRSDDRRCNKSDGVTGNVFGITGLVDSGHEEVDPTSSLFLSRKSVLPNGYDESKVSRNSELGKISGSSNLLVNVEKGEYSGRLNKTAFDMTAAGTDMGENSIISNILSMDFDAWDDSLTSPHNLVKLLSKTDKQHNSLKLSSSLKVQNNNQSRFSFAREDLANPVSDLDNSFNNLGHNKYSVPQDYTVDRDPYSEKLRNGFTSSMFAETDTFPSNLSLASSNKLAASRSQISAPPGFSIPSRAPAPPPGFSTQERMEQTFESFSGNHLLESSMLRNQYLAQTGGVADVELIDPAILAVGKGRVPNGISNSGLDMRSTYTPQLSLPESDPRLQILMQQSISQHQNLRYPDHNADRFSALSDAYRVQSRYLEQTQANNLSPFRQLSLQQSRNAHMLNGHWDEVQTSNELSMAELLRNERLGLNKHYSSYEDQKFRMPSSGDIYKRAYGI